MIASLTGEPLSLTPDTCILSVGGVGYDVRIPFSTYRSIKESGSAVSLFIHTYVREDTLALYGFSTLEEREVFLKLISLNGVGPRVALCILSGLSTQEFIEAVDEGDVGALSSIPGIGPKTSSRIVFELKGKLVAGDLQGEGSSIKKDALSALQNLGYRPSQAQKALERILKSETITDLEDLLVKALRELSR